MPGFYYEECLASSSLVVRPLLVPQLVDGEINPGRLGDVRCDSTDRVESWKWVHFAIKLFRGGRRRISQRQHVNSWLGEPFTSLHPKTGLTADLSDKRSFSSI